MFTLLRLRALIVADSFINLVINRAAITIFFLLAFFWRNEPLRPVLLRKTSVAVCADEMQGKVRVRVVDNRAVASAPAVPGDNRRRAFLSRRVIHRSHQISCPL